MGYDLPSEEVESFIIAEREGQALERITALRAFLQHRERKREKIYDRLPTNLTEIKNELCSEVDGRLCERPDYVLVLSCISSYIEMVKNTSSMYLELQSRLPLRFQEVDPITPELMNDDFNWISFVDAFTTLNRYMRERRQECATLSPPKIYVSIPS
jgi:hypothetical protein